MEGQENVIHLSEEQLQHIAERAAEIALENVYKSIGKSVVSKFLWLVGAGALAAAAWLQGAGHWPAGK